MSSEIHHEISTSGQIVEVKTTKHVLANSESLIQALVEKVSAPDIEAEEGSAAPQQAVIKSFHALGDGVCAFQRIGGTTIKTYGGILLETIPFYTNWQLEKENDRYFLRPFNGTNGATPIELGAPLVMNVPNDLIIHFFVEWQHNASIDVVMPDVQHIADLPALLGKNNVANYYLTCFSRSRNTCVRLPLPNLYDDAHLCTGSAFSEPTFGKAMNHSGVMRSVKTYANSWKETSWNNDLLGGTNTDRTAQYHKLVRFSADDGRYIGSGSSADWPVGSSPVPLEEVYAPWFSKPVPKAEPATADPTINVETGRINPADWDPPEVAPRPPMAGGQRGR
jgi:hypothetical protein